MNQWQALALSPDKTHLLTSFSQPNSAGLIYNFYADKLLQLGLVPQSVRLSTYRPPPLRGDFR